MILDCYGKQLISDIVTYDKYAKHLNDLNRREDWDEITTRYLDMMKNKYSHLEKKIDIHGKLIFNKEILPSMRGLQFAGKPIEISPNRIFNCAYMPAESRKFFRELMFLLIGGSGVGYSVQHKYIKKLPSRKNITRSARVLVGDSKEGWSHAIDMLFKGYLEQGIDYVFDYLDVREEGTILKTSGGKAPGGDKLKRAIEACRKILKSLKPGQQLSPLQVHDCACFIAEAVYAGGIRRAALIAFFDENNDEMLSCKFSENFRYPTKDNPVGKNLQRSKANNSVVIPLDQGLSEFKINYLIKKTMKACELSGSGEPGIVFSKGDMLGNPCFEIRLKPYQFCNLTEINASITKNETHFLQQCESASFFSTLQAGFTDFHFLRPEWRETTEKEALIGVGITGICHNKLDPKWLKQGKDRVDTTNKIISNLIHINPAKRTTCIKPSGTSSQVLGSITTGIHAGFGNYIIRRIRLQKNQDIYQYLVKKAPSMIEDEIGDNAESIAVVSIPIHVGDSVTKREDETIKDQLNRVALYMRDWIGFKSEKDFEHVHNVSFTGNVRDNEWEYVTKWIQKNKYTLGGMSFMPYWNGHYPQAPYEEIDKNTYIKMVEQWVNVKIDLKEILESADTTNLTADIACAGGSCEI